MHRIDTTYTHLSTDANGTPKVDLELVARIFVAGALDDAIQTVSSVVDDDVDATKVFVDSFEERFGAVGGVSDIIFDNEELVSGVGCSEVGDAGCLACNCCHTFARRDHLLDRGLTNTRRSTSDYHAQMSGNARAENNAWQLTEPNARTRHRR